MLLGVLAHLAVEAFVGVEVVQVLRDGIVVAGGHEVAGLAVLDLERDTTSAAGDNGASSVQRFGDLDFEALASGELEGDAGVRHQGVEHWEGGHQLSWPVHGKRE